MDFFPTLASIVGGKMPTDRPLDGMAQSDVLFGKSASGHRESLYIHRVATGGGTVEAMARLFIHPTGIGPERLPGGGSASGTMAGYPKLYNIQMDPHADHNIASMFGWVLDPAYEELRKYEKSVKKYPNPPAPNLTVFGSCG